MSVPEVLLYNEYQRLQFFSRFADLTSLREEQIAEFEPEEVDNINRLAMKLIWASMERRNVVKCGGDELEQVYRGYEENIIPLEEFVLENTSRQKLFALQEAIWHRVVRLVGERQLTNPVEVVELYDGLNQPYFRLSWLDACALKGSQD